MPLEYLTMSGAELDRAEWMLRVRERRATQAQVAKHSPQKRPCPQF